MSRKVRELRMENETTPSKCAACTVAAYVFATGEAQQKQGSSSAGGVCWLPGVFQRRRWLLRRTWTMHIQVKKLIGRVIEGLNREPKSFSDFTDLDKGRWPKNAFSRTSVSEDDLLECPWEWDLAQITTGDFRSESRAEKLLMARFRGGEELLAQNTGLGRAGQKRRYVYNLVAVSGCFDVINLEEVYNCAWRLRDPMKKEGRDKVVVADDRVRGDTLRRVLEYVFAGTEVGIKIARCPSRKTQTQVIQAPRAPPQRRGVAKAREEALLLKVGAGKSYAELLRDVRKNVDLEKTGAEVASIRKTREGDLLLPVKGKEGGSHLSDLEKEIQGKCGGIEIRTLRDKGVVLHINGLDGATTKEELEEAVGAALPAGVTGVEIRAIWPARGDSQNASIELSRPLAGLLLEKGRIRVGWTQCRIRERVEVLKCFRCWETGHIRQNCKGPDRSALCHKCGCEGHVATSCGNDMFCPVCAKAGHRACGTGCPAFRRALGNTGQT